MFIMDGIKNLEVDGVLLKPSTALIYGMQT
jgi:hypothetical protein